MTMVFRDEKDMMEDYCPHCGQYTGGDSECSSCGKEIFDEEGLEEHEEGEEEGGTIDRDQEEDDYPEEKEEE